MIMTVRRLGQVVKIGLFCESVATNAVVANLFSPFNPEISFFQMQGWDCRFIGFWKSDFYLWIHQWFAFRLLFRKLPLAPNDLKYFCFKYISSKLNVWYLQCYRNLKYGSCMDNRFQSTSSDRFPSSYFSSSRVLCWEYLWRLFISDLDQLYRKSLRSRCQPLTVRLSEWCPVHTGVSYQIVLLRTIKYYFQRCPSSPGSLWFV